MIKCIDEANYCIIECRKLQYLVMKIESKDKIFNNVIIFDIIFVFIFIKGKIIACMHILHTIKNYIRTCMMQYSTLSKYDKVNLFFIFIWHVKASYLWTIKEYISTNNNAENNNRFLICEIFDELSNMRYYRRENLFVLCHIDVINLAKFLDTPHETAVVSSVWGWCLLSDAPPINQTYGR